MSRHLKHLARNAAAFAARLNPVLRKHATTAAAYGRDRYGRIAATAEERYERIAALAAVRSALLVEAAAERFPRATPMIRERFSRVWAVGVLVVLALGVSLLAGVAGGADDNGKHTETTATSIRDTQDRSSRDKKRDTEKSEDKEKDKEKDDEKKGPHWVAPSPERVTDKYGPRGWRDGDMHWGLDFAAAPGEDNLAAFDGTVVMAQEYGGYGKCVVIKHADGVQTLYGHFSDIDVKAGDEVKAGDVLGQAGSTGDSTGPHLHFEVSIDGEYTDPLKFLRDHDVDL